MDSGLAGITAYVSQDCTGMKDGPTVDKTGNWALCLSCSFDFFQPFFCVCKTGAMKMLTGAFTVFLPVTDTSIPNRIYPFQCSLNP